jgi:putative nucleotidyltransferase with HDIG domain
MRRAMAGNSSSPVNLLLVPLGVVELTVPETIVLAVAGAIVNSADFRTWRRFGDSVVRTCTEATAAAAAAFAYHSLVHAEGSVAVRLFLAGAVFFVARTLPEAIVIASKSGARIASVWRDRYFWSFPHYFVGASAAGFLSIRNSFLHWEACLLIAPVLYVLYRAHRLSEAGVEHERELFSKLRTLYLRTIETLALTVEAKDENTGGHLNRVQIYAVELARDLGLNDEDAEALRVAALLHDIGKLAIPDSILSKPGKLTRPEFAKIKTHPIIGAEILQHAQFPYQIAPIVRAHHERWDGSGYPEGLKGAQIPIGARILSAVDCLDALASDREYRPALSLDEAMAKIEAESGRGYDPVVVAALKRRYREIEHMVQERASLLPRLSKNVVVERGEAPAAGFSDELAAEEALAHMAENIGIRSSDVPAATACPRVETQ